MKKIFFMAIAVIGLMASCTKDNFENENKVIEPCAGQEVSFSVGVDGGATRTLYGDEAADGKSIVVNWVKGDKVKVYGTNCSASRSEAEYKVLDEADGNNYSADLTITGDYGVQWGNELKSDFYSVYPSIAEKNQFEPIVGANNEIEGVTVMTKIRNKQDVAFVKEGNVWVGTHYNGVGSNPTMTDAVMYAVTKDVSAGAAVKLQYKPFSTVLRFTFNGFNIKVQAGEGMSGSVDNTVYVRSIKIQAPWAIAGEFPLVIGKDGTAFVDDSDIDKEENKTIVITPDYLPLSTEQSVQFDVFTIPCDQDLTADNYFVVTIETSNFGSFTYHMRPKVVDGTKNRLVAGQMHKTTIPANEVTKAVTIPASSWMKYVPRNVYLSELSVPGAWYCMDSGYQGSDASLEKLYAAGVRTFNIDCRISKKNCNDFEYDGLFVNVNPGDTEYEFEWKDSDYDSDGTKSYLACSGTENVAKGVGDGILSTLTGMYQITEGVYVENALQQIVDLAQSAKQKDKDGNYVTDASGNNIYNEIIFVIFSFAEKPHSNAVIGNKIFGSVNPNYISEQLTKVLNKYSDYIYTNVNADTTLGDVLASGKNIVVKINHSNSSFYDGSFLMPNGIMASYASMAMSGWISGNITSLPSDYYSKMQQSPIYNGTSSNNMNYYFCQAQKTYSSAESGTPTIDQRKAAIDAVLGKAKEIYGNSTHNALFQLGVGGTLDGSDQSNIASQLNSYVQTKLEEKLANGDVSPLGFVLMNHCLSYTKLLQDILSFNTKFVLNRDATKDEWPENCGGNPYEELYGSGDGSQDS